MVDVRRYSAAAPIEQHIVGKRKETSTVTQVDVRLADLAQVLADEHTRSTLTGRCDWCGDRWPCQDAAWATGYLCLLNAVMDTQEPPAPHGAASSLRGEGP